MIEPNRHRIRLSVLVLAMLSLALPTIVLTAAPAAAAPVTDPVFSKGRAGLGNFGLALNEASSFVQNTANFGPSGTVVVDSVTLLPTDGVSLGVDEVTQDHLDSIDIFFDGWVSDGSWAAGELSLLVDWVDDGGVLLANEDDPSADALAAAFGVTVAGSRDGDGDTDAKYTPAAGAAAHPIIDGPFGEWTQVDAGGTSGWFTTPLPAGWTVIAEDEDGRPVLIERASGDGFVVLTSDEGMFRTAAPIDPADDNDIATGNILAHLIQQTDDTVRPLALVNPGDQSGSVGDAVSLPLITTKGDGSAITFSDGGTLPAGLSIAGGTGLISGTLAGPATTTTVTITATPVSGTPDTATFDWVVGSGLAVTDPGDQAGMVGDPVSLQIATTGGDGSDVTFSDGGTLPAGLSIGSTTGLISGTLAGPATTTTVEVTATPDTGTADSVMFDWVVSPDAVPVAVDDDVAGTVGQALAFDICDNDTDGDGANTVTLDGTLPPGVALTGCALSGTPTTAGSTDTGYTLTDADGDADSAVIRFTIGEVAPPSTDCRPGGVLSLDAPTPGTPAGGDAFGDVVVTGDFDGDGNLDVAVGSPGDNDNAGSVTIFSAPCDDPGRRITQAGAVPGDNEAGDRFGASLAVGDFNNDGFDDLAIGVPGEDTGDRRNDGNVVVLYGSADGLRKKSGEEWNQRWARPGRPQSGDKLGSALAVGDFDNDGFDDLLIGVSGEDIDGRRNAGAFMVFYGSNVGLTNAGSELFKQKGPLTGASQRGDRLGTSMVVGDFDGDGFDDAAVAAPKEDTAGGNNSGIVHVLPGSTDGLTTTGQRVIKGTAAGQKLGDVMVAADVTRDGVADLVLGLDDAADRGTVAVHAGSPGGLSLLQTFGRTGGVAGDRFGSALAVGDVDDDGVAELVVGASGQTVGAASKAGAIHVYEADGTGVTVGSGTQIVGSGVATARFGAAVVVAEELIFVSAPKDLVDGVRSGTVTPVVFLDI